MTKEEIEQRDILREIELESRRECVHLERVIGKRRSMKESSNWEYLCKWRNNEHRNCTWEEDYHINTLYQQDIDSFEDREGSNNVPPRSTHYKSSRPKFVKLDKQPDYIVGGVLRDYQMIGLNWMAYLWHKGDNGILADEMVRIFFNKIVVAMVQSCLTAI